MNGCNDNPSEQQFTAAYKKLLFQNEISTSDNSNCQNDVTSILFVSSGKKNIAQSDNANYPRMLHELADEDLAYLDAENDNNELENHSRAYLASIVEVDVIQKISRRGKKICLKCIDIFIENEITDDQFMAFKFENNNTYQPCKST